MTMNEGVYKNVHDRDEEECNAARRKINQQGAIAQMGERLLCTQEVGGSIPPGSTIVVLKRGFDERVAKRFLYPCLRVRLQRKAATRDKDKDL